MKYFAPIILSAVYTLLSLSDLQGLVLCYGADGHIELEMTYSGKCGENSDEKKCVAADSIVSLEDCGPCVDILLAANLDVFSGKKDKNNSPLQNRPVLSSSEYTFTFSPITSWQPHAFSQGGYQPLASSLCTVILLI